MKRLLSIFLVLILLTGTARAASVSVAVIDTGVRLREELLDGEKLLPGYNYVLDSDDTRDRVGHGTRIASLILGSRDGTISSPCRETAVLPLVYYTQLPSGAVRNGGVELICRAIREAVDLYGCRIINLSSGIAGPDPDLAEAAAYAEAHGVLLVSSAGNDGGALSYPAALPGVIAVGSCGPDARPSPFSARGQELTLLAPGENCQTVSIRNAEAYETVSGTSYAAALVTAQAAAVLERYPELTLRELRFALQFSCRDILAPGRDRDSGWGILDPEALLEAAAGLADGSLLPYWDVRPGQWFFADVQNVSRLGLMQGTGGDRFSPDQPVTRAMAAAVLHRLEGAPAPRSAAPFSDVAPDSWYASSVAWAAEQGLLLGVGQGRFAPEDVLTREQLAALLYRRARAKQLPPASSPGGAELSSFADAASASPWAIEALSWACGRGLLRGTSDTALSPGAPVDRAQLAAIVTRLPAPLPAAE